MRLLGHRGLRRLLNTHGGGQYYTVEASEEEEEEEVEFEPVPSEAGRELMNSGTFGANVRLVDSIKRKKRLSSRLLRREMGLGSIGRQRARSGLLKQVCKLLCYSTRACAHYNAGPNTILESRHDHTLRISLLLGPILQ
jgi:hypothetical protein